MKKKFALGVLGFVLVFGGGSYAFSHSGDLDKFGCHTDHKTNVYHCHR